MCYQGHSPAGGCLMSMSCDYRIMAPNYTIGLNETQLVGTSKNRERKNISYIKET